MKIQEFLDFIDETAQKEGFQEQFLILVADKNGKLNQWTHVWNENFKRCNFIDKIVKKLKRRSVFKQIY